MSCVRNGEIEVMKSMSVRCAKDSFGLIIDYTLVAPVLIEKHGRGVVVMSIDKYERLSRLAGDDKG